MTVRRWLARVTADAPTWPLVVLFGLNAVDELDRAAFGVLLPEIRAEFGLDLTALLGVVSLVAVVALLLQVPVAALADRLPRTRLAAGGAFAWSGFALLTGLAPTLVVLGAARAGSGIGKAVIDPTHNSLLSDYYPIETRPRVFATHRAANAAGACVGPIAAGLLAHAFGWRVPFVVFAVPSAVLAGAALLLPEPSRGHSERLAAGASGAALTTDEPAPSFAEAWRIVWKIPTLRRVWWSLPFLAAALIGVNTITALAYGDLFGLGERGRGFAAAATEPAQFAGLVIGARVGLRRLADGPEAAVRAMSRVAWLVAAAMAAFALAPNLPAAIVANAAIAASLATLAPGIFSILAAAIPPRARAMGFSVASLWVVPGLLALPVVGWIGERTSLRAGLLCFVPLFLIGGRLLARTHQTAAADIAEVRASAAARAADAARRADGSAPRLLVRDLHVGYDDVPVVFGIDLEVGPGECVALLGTNGAGKSTVLRAISGITEADRGTILLDGREVTHAPPHEIAALGIALVPGGRGVFPTLTVAENLAVAARFAGRRARQATRAAYELFPALAQRRTSPAGDLSGGQQQMLALAMALSTEPRVLLVDELSLGLAPSVVAQLLPVIRSACARGVAVVLVEQSVQTALELADTAVFLEKGEVRYRGPTGGLLERPDVLRSVFLDGARAAFDRVTVRGPGPPRASAQEGTPTPVLAAHGVSVSFGGIRAVDRVDLEVASGEAVALIGANGAGKTTLFDVLSGFVAPAEGRVALGGRDVTRLGPAARARSGLGRTFQDARLFPALTVAETLAVACERAVEIRDPLSAALGLPNVYESERRVARRVDELIDLLNLGRYRHAFVRELSTGTRHVVDLACVLAHQPAVVLLDEPSAGLAQRETEALALLVQRVREVTGAAVVVIEHDMGVVRAVADRLVALDQGRVIATGAPDTVLRDPAVVAAYLGTRADTEPQGVPS